MHAGVNVEEFGRASDLLQATLAEEGDVVIKFVLFIVPHSRDKRKEALRDCAEGGYSVDYAEARRRLHDASLVRAHPGSSGCIRAPDG